MFLVYDSRGKVSILETCEHKTMASATRVVSITVNERDEVHVAVLKDRQGQNSIALMTLDELRI